MAARTHQWTIDVAAKLTPDQALALANGHQTRVPIAGLAESIYCSRCWAKWTLDRRHETCLAASRRES